MFNIASKDKQLDRTTVSSVFYKLGQKEKKEKTRISELLVDFHENGLLLTILFFCNTSCNSAAVSSRFYYYSRYSFDDSIYADVAWL